MCDEVGMICEVLIEEEEKKYWLPVPHVIAEQRRRKGLRDS